MFRNFMKAAVACLFTAMLAAPVTLAQSRQQQPPQAQPAAQQAPPSTDITHITDEALVWLQDLVRINTTNPPGNELLAAKYIGTVLQKENIPFEIIESTPGRGFLVARLNAGPFPDPSRALILMAHLDVVGVDKTKWTVDPFGGVIKDGYIYGRGVIDDKGMLAANLAVFISLKRTGARLNRDIILLAEGDEEAGGEDGMIFAVQKHWDKIAAAYAINEEGRVIVANGKVQYVGIQAAEKVPVNVNVIATGTSGHGSIPRPDNAVVHLAAAVEKIGGYEAPVQLNTITRAYFEGLAKIEDDETSKWMRALETSDRQEHASRILSQSPIWNSMMRDTIAPTMLQAGIRVNVVPSMARATLNIRLLPGNLLEPLLGKLTQLVNDPQVRFEPQTSVGQPAPSSPVDSDFFNEITLTAANEFPGVTVIPMMSTGATDSQQLRLRSVKAYGLLPFPLPEGEVMRMHADDERLPVDSFRKGVLFLDHIIAGFAVSQ
jgi:acetylornithine deacetylase/succinyl-diaminopimelate desuccinylase-like protein